MSTQTSSRFKRFAIITFALAGLGVVAKWVVPADAANQVLSGQKQKAPAAVIVAQSATQPSTGQEAAPLPEGQKSEAKADEKDEAAEPKKKALKNFRPSEQIEAEQAVDFPYDI